MGRVILCDFCDKPGGNQNKLKVRAKHWSFLPGMLIPAIYKLWLHDRCYNKMVEYIVNNKAPK